MPTTAKVLIAHDYFPVPGGAERLVLELCRSIGADLLFGYRTTDTFEDGMFPPAFRDLYLPKILQRRGLRVLALAAAFSRERRAAARYETRIFSGVVSPFAAPPLNAPGRNIFYCHTPPRFLYDLRASYDAEGSAVRRLASRVLKPVFQRQYEATVARMHTIVANSQNVRKRIADYLGRDSVVVYPPCDTESFTWQSQQGYYLSTARLSTLKRVDKIVEAFVRMPDKKLVVASQGEEFDRLKALASDTQNIKFLGWVSEADLRRLIGEAIATIYIPVDEDYGMSPAESMAAGKPCIGVAEGGLLETVLDGETGILLQPDFAVDNIIEAVSWLTPQRALSMRYACEIHAGQFDRRMFVERMREIISMSR